MTVFKRTIRLFSVFIGALGVLVCVAAGAVCWWTGARLDQANEKVFNRIGTAVAAGRDRVLDAQKRAQTLKITTQDIRQGAESWIRRESKEHVAALPEVGGKVEQLAIGLQQVDAWLEISGTSLQGAQQALETAQSLGAAADPTVVDPWLEQLGVLRARVKESTQTVEVIRARIVRAAEGETLEERINRLGELALRVVATLGEIDSRLGQVAEGLVAVQARGVDLKNRTHRYIATAQIAAVAFMAWMALGQFFLARYGGTKRL